MAGTTRKPATRPGVGLTQKHISEWIAFKSGTPHDFVGTNANGQRIRGWEIPKVRLLGEPVYAATDGSLVFTSRERVMMWNLFYHWYVTKELVVNRNLNHHDFDDDQLGDISQAVVFEILEAGHAG